MKSNTFYGDSTVKLVPGFPGFFMRKHGKSNYLSIIFTIKSP